MTRTRTWKWWRDYYSEYRLPKTTFVRSTGIDVYVDPAGQESLHDGLITLQTVTPFSRVFSDYPVSQMETTTDTLRR
ncbi:MAG: hypothetical protein GF334_09145 [Candidatus Altiarchaeales archaeon]|nr:hypothetical protein [Candidatus Altiarchaeales archaeon]